VEVVSNTSTVALRVVGDHEKRSLESEIVKHGRESQKANGSCKRHDIPLVRDSAPNQQSRTDSNKNLVVSSRWVLYSKMD
jgi:hypothetical protein